MCVVTSFDEGDAITRWLHRLPWRRARGGPWPGKLVFEPVHREGYAQRGDELHRLPSTRRRSEATEHHPQSSRRRPQAGAWIVPRRLQLVVHDAGFARPEGSLPPDHIDTSARLRRGIRSGRAEC